MRFASPTQPFAAMSGASHEPLSRREPCALLRSSGPGHGGRDRGGGFPEGAAGRALSPRRGRRRAERGGASRRRPGGGKAERFHVADEARARGIEPVELKPGDDLEVLVNDAVAAGADALAAAGGDGTQAIVATIAADHGLAYACIPAGTRNHFALDL